MPVPASSILPTLADLKAHLGRTVSTDDAELQGFLNAAVRRVEKRVGRLDAYTVTDEVHDGGRANLILNHYPVLEVTAASYWDGTTITVADLEVSESGIVEWGYNTAGSFTSGRRNVRITYTVGRATLDPLLREAILEFARDSWDASQTGGAAVEPSYPGVDNDDEFVPRSSGYVRAVSLIDDYLRAQGPVVA